MSDCIEHRGCQLHFDRTGAGPAVLFIQGVGVHGAGWAPQTDALAERYTCLTFDNRGIGRSQPVGAPVTLEQLAEDALTVLDAAGCTTAHVVGHSLGGVIALYLAIAAPQRVESLALLCTFAGGHAVAPLTARMMWLGMRSRVGTRIMRRRGFMSLVLPPNVRGDAALAERLGMLFGHDIADQPAIAGAQLRALRRSDARHGLAALASIPTLVMSATHDPIAPPASGRALAAAIPGARYQEVADASHGLPITHPGIVNARLEALWTGRDPTKKPLAT